MARHLPNDARKLRATIGLNRPEKSETRRSPPAAVRDPARHATRRSPVSSQILRAPIIVLRSARLHLHDYAMATEPSDRFPGIGDAEARAPKRRARGSREMRM